MGQKEALEGTSPLRGSRLLRFSTTGLYLCGRYLQQLPARLNPLTTKVGPHLPLPEPGPSSESHLIAMMTGALRTLFPRSRVACYTYHLCAANSLTSVSQVKGTSWMRIAEIEGDKRYGSHLEQEERGFTRCRAERRLRREMAVGMKPSHRTARGEGGDS